MKDAPNKKQLKDYERELVTWNKGKHGKYKKLKKLNKRAFNLSVSLQK